MHKEGVTVSFEKEPAGIRFAWAQRFASMGQLEPAITNLISAMRDKGSVSAAIQKKSVVAVTDLMHEKALNAESTLEAKEFLQEAAAIIAPFDKKKSVMLLREAERIQTRTGEISNGQLEIATTESVVPGEAYVSMEDIEDDRLVNIDTNGWNVIHEDELDESDQKINVLEGNVEKTLEKG